MRTSDLKIFSGNANPELAREISDDLYIELGSIEVGRFADGETKVRILEDVRGRDVFVVQPTCPPVNQNMMELLIIIDALKRASAERVTAVIPYYGYARQDRKHEGRVPITAKLVANLITISGANRVLALDLHSTQIQGFFDLPMDHIYARPVLIRYLKRQKIENPVVMSTDIGGSKQANTFSLALDGDLAVIGKRRVDDQNVERAHVVGDVRGRNVIILDDMITTAGSMQQAVETAREYGAASVTCVATHGLFSGPAWDRLARVEMRELVVTNSVPVAQEKSGSQPHGVSLTVLSIAHLLGEAIKRIHANESMSKLFEAGALVNARRQGVET